MARVQLRPGERGVIQTRKHPDGYVIARANYRTYSGERRNKTARGKTVGEARRKLSDRIDDELREDSNGDGDAGGGVLFAAVAEEWLEHGELQVKLEAKAKTTHHEHARIVRSRLIPAFGAMPVAEVTSEKVYRYYTHLAGTHAPLARNVKGIVSQVMGHAVNLGYISANPVATVKAIRRTKKEIFAPNVDELIEFRSAAVAYMEDEERPGPKPSSLVIDTIDLILATGFRISEVLGIRIKEDLHLIEDPPYVRISGAVKERGGKRWEPMPKTETSLREVELAPFAIEVVMRRIANADPEATYLFETRTGAPNGPQDVHRALRNIRRHAGLPDDYVPHSLRKNVATSVARVAGLESAASVLGHARARVTENSYAKRDLRAYDPRSIVQSQFEAIVGNQRDATETVDVMEQLARLRAGKKRQ